MKRGLLALASVLTALLGAASGRAQNHAPTHADDRADAHAEDTARAKSYFDAALQAYAAAQYLAAADAFLKAHTLLPSPSLIFSAAQAYRRQFFIDQSPTHLREAMRLYRDYLTQAEQGRRRQEASDALLELGPFELRPGAATAEPQKAHPTQILVASRTPGAETSIDGGPSHKVPLVAPVLPGEHTAVVRAPGYFEETSKVIALERETFYLNVLLRPRPVELHARGDAGARLYLDGQLLTRLPTEKPLRLSGGEHHLAMTLPGHVPYSTALSVASGSRVDLDVTLPPTFQRYLAYATLGLAGASAVLTGTLGGVAMNFHAEAQAIDGRKHAQGQITVAERDRYNDALASRDALLAGTAVAGSIAAALGVAGLSLYLFDDPDVAAAGSGAPGGAAPPKPPSDTELLLGGSGVFLLHRF